MDMCGEMRISHASRIEFWQHRLIRTSVLYPVQTPSTSAALGPRASFSDCLCKRCSRNGKNAKGDCDKVYQPECVNVSVLDSHLSCNENFGVIELGSASYASAVFRAAACSSSGMTGAGTL